MSTEFNWTDENVKEFVTNLLRNGFYDIPKHLADFKASKQPKQDWEIISLKNDGYIYKLIVEQTYMNGAHTVSLKWALENKFEIHSVKRLSDGEVFSIGDAIVHGVCNTIIKKIEVCNFGNGNKIKFQGEDTKEGKIGPWIWLDEDMYNSGRVEKVKQTLFTTEDSIPTYEGDSVWKVCILKDSWSLDEVKARQELLPIPSYFKYFSTKEKAEEYRNNNIPCLSIIDTYDAWSGNIVRFKEKILEKVKEKLNKS